MILGVTDNKWFLFYILFINFANHLENNTTHCIGTVSKSLDEIDSVKSTND